MVIGVSRISLALPANESLKDKRRVVRRIVDRTRNQFNAAVAEVGALDRHRSAELGFAVVSNDARHANSMLEHIANFVAGASEAVVIGRTVEIVHVGHDHPGLVPPETE